MHLGVASGGNFIVNAQCDADITIGLGNFVGQVQIVKDKNSYTGRFTASPDSGAVAGITNGVKK